MDGHSKLNQVYKGMKQRCFNSNDMHYKNYGARGITVCPEWLDSEEVKLKGSPSKGWLTFKKWALENGYKEGLTIDRINVNGNYEPSNCRWINIKEQQSNRRSCKFITYKGKTQCMKNWCKELNLNYNRIKNRFRIGWNVERAFEE